MSTTPQFPQPGRPGTPPPAPGMPPAPGQGSGPDRKSSWFARHKVLTVIGAVVVVGVGAAALGGGGDDEAVDAGTTTSAGTPAGTADDTAAEIPAAEPAAEEPAALPAIGETVADGSFEFVVTQVEPGVARVGDDILGQDAQGQFVLVHLTVTNIGTEAQYFLGGSQKLLDTQGRTHSSDLTAEIYLGDTNGFVNQINPGNQVEGVVVYDVPADAVPASIELHDSPFSGGVTVALG
ncbi:MAG TPA: DUF4352 domain-containing protein [Cellulomonas sp.]